MNFRSSILFATTLIACCCFSIPKINAQPLGIAWQKTIGCMGIELGTSFIIDDEGYYVIAGQAGDSCEYTGHYSGFMDGWVVKLDSLGNKIWSATAGGDSADAFVKIKQTSDGGYIAVGSTRSVIGANIKRGHDDFWIVKFSRNGSILWQKTYGTADFDFAWDVAETKNGYFVVGFAGGQNSGTVDGDLTNSKGGPCDAWIIKLDTSGNLLWEKTYGSSGADNYFVIQQTPDSNFILAGKVGAMNSDVTAPVNGHDAIFLQKMDTAGNILWTKNYGGSVFQIPQLIFQDPDGGYLLGAKTTSDDLDVSSNYGGYDMWAIRTNDTGKILWQKTYGGTKDDDFDAIVKSKEGGYMFFGSANSDDFDAVGNHGAYTDALVIKVNDTGAIAWHQMYGGSLGDGAGDAYQLSDSSYIFAGGTNSHNGDVVSTLPNGGTWIVKLKKDVNTGVANLNKESGLRVYPTITQDIITVDAAYDISKASVQLFDLSGKKIAVPFTKSNRQFVLQTGSLASGMYFVNVRTGREERTFKIVIN
ncbi:T9SS type A sorting domain-containing protein [Taibaiella soli]|uniref:Secretion system C-terminal sorting domain-containing protein n=1 Tax=Taibaiella soli TaxID=1649169 RepID=A0A2W2AFM8_9BACT|nr:T9SS type A sorting domain-containing protein [Taibaiella soli]PZF71010.1 hypothetical protein DN068_20110 [Taibaiella soli]